MPSTKPSSLFEPLVSRRRHVAFERLRVSGDHVSARRMMETVFAEMGDPDGNFVDDFQGPGFHSRLFELACFAYLREGGWAVDRSQRSPDFIASSGSVSVAIEAVTANSPRGRDEDIASIRMTDPITEDVLAKCNDELPIRIGSALFSKLQRRYWELPVCHGLPLVLMVAPFHEPGCTTYVDDSLRRYLFGTESYKEWTARNGLFVREAPISSHSFGGKAIPSNFFAQDGAENISAVLWCNQFTVARFYRLATATEGLPRGALSAVVQGYAVDDDGRFEPFEYSVGDLRARTESWSRGVTIFLNPRARVPLPANTLAATSIFSRRDGRVVRDVTGWHTLTSWMYVTARSATQCFSGLPAFLQLTDDQLLGKIEEAGGEGIIGVWQDSRTRRFQVGLRNVYLPLSMALSVHGDQDSALIAARELEARMDRLANEL